MQFGHWTFILLNLPFGQSSTPEKQEITLCLDDHAIRSKVRLYLSMERNISMAATPADFRETELTIRCTKLVAAQYQLHRDLSYGLKRRKDLWLVPAVIPSVFPWTLVFLLWSLIAPVLITVLLQRSERWRLENRFNVCPGVLEIMERYRKEVWNKHQFLARNHFLAIIGGEDGFPELSIRILATDSRLKSCCNNSRRSIG